MATTDLKNAVNYEKARLGTKGFGWSKYNLSAWSEVCLKCMLEMDCKVEEAKRLEKEVAKGQVLDLTKDTEEEEEEEEVEVEGTAEKVAELKLEEGEAPKDYDLLDLGRLGEGPFGAEGCGDRGEFYGLDEDSIDAESGVKMRAGQQQDRTRMRMRWW